MSNILVIPDVHLKFNILYPIIKNIMSQNKVDQLVFLGDYFDDWSQQTNNKLYQETCDYLTKLNTEYNCVFLLGNHDVPYLTGHLQYYSNHDPNIISLCRDILLSLSPRIAYKEDDIIYSHAGFMLEPDKFDFQIYDGTDERHHIRLMLYDNGSTQHLSPLWIRPDVWQYELRELLPPQVVGHSPVPDITTFEAERFGSKLVVCDTYSHTSRNQKIGNYALVLVQDGQIERIY